MDNARKRVALLVVVLVVVGTFFVFLVPSSTTSITSPPTGTNEQLPIKDQVTAEVVRGRTSPTVQALGYSGYVTLDVVRKGVVVQHAENHNLQTNAGIDFESVQLFQSTGIGSNGANYIGLTNTAITPSASDTTLSGEIATNGLSRAQGTYSHPTQSTTKIVKTFTATGSQSAQASGLFTASSGGTLFAEATFTQVNLLTDDQLTVTWTITYS